MKQGNFFAELKRRNVYKVAVAYGVVGWLIIQVTATIVPALHLPEGLTTAVVVLVLLGFPIALIIAWAFEMTPQGLKRTENVSPDEISSLPYWSARKFAAVIAALATLAAGLLAYQFLRPKNSTIPDRQARTANESPPPGSKSIAVLPFVNMSADQNDEYFSDGLSEELIAALAQIRELKVIGRSSSFRFKDRKEEPKTIGERLGVRTLLEGTVRKQGDKVRIVAELINAADGIELWAQTFDRELKDIFAVQEEIAMKVSAALKVTLLGPEQQPTVHSATQNVEAHNVYLLGHSHFQRRNVKDYRRAIEYFDQAIGLDSNYALAYAERSETWTLLGDLTGTGKEAWPKARADAEKALALAPTLAEAHAAVGWVLFFTDWKFAEGLKELRRAKDLSPANPTANDLLARCIVYVGDLNEAEKQARLALELDPLSLTAMFNLARNLFIEGKLDEAEEYGRKMAELQPSATSSHRWQVLVAIQRGDGEAALREAQLEPDEGFRRFELTLAHDARGDRAAADAALADLIANGQGLTYQIAQVYAVRGDADKALQWLQTSLDTRDTGMLGLQVDPLLRGLRNDSRYRALVAKMNFPTTQ